MKKFTALLLAVLLICSLGACNSAKTPDPTPSAEPSVTESYTPDITEPPASSVTSGKIILSTTTSTQDSGLLDYLLPIFTAETGIEVDVIAVGTGQAIRMGEDGEADVLLVHDTASEEKFVEEGHSFERRNVMYNDFVLIGPKDDPAGIKSEFGDDIAGALKKISTEQLSFVSRGDDSGTHKKELRLWKSIDLESPEGDWYVSVGKGMGDTIAMAEELSGYTISDRATYLSMQDQLELEILVEGDTTLFNQYGVLVVNPDKNDSINAEGAQIFADWLVSSETQEKIETFGVEEYGEPLFIANA